MEAALFVMENAAAIATAATVLLIPPAPDLAERVRVARGLPIPIVRAPLPIAEDVETRPRVASSSVRKTIPPAPDLYARVRAARASKPTAARVTSTGQTIPAAPSIGEALRHRLAAGSR